MQDLVTALDLKASALSGSPLRQLALLRDALGVVYIFNTWKRPAE